MDPAFRKAKIVLGLKLKRKKKGKQGLVLENAGARETDPEVPREVVPLLKGDSLEGPQESAAEEPPVVPNTRRSKLKTCIQADEPKPQSFQIAINITEARQLVGENIDPSVVIEIGDEKKQTSVKEGTNAPFYNEYFVFDFFAIKELFFDKVIKLTVIHSKILKSYTIGSFKLDVWTVYRQPGRQFVNKWAMLTNPADISTGIKGYVKCDISVTAKGDAVQPGAKTHDSEEQIDKNLLIPEGFPSERPWARFSVKVYKAESLPRNNSGLMANVTKAFIGDNTALVDPYVVVSFFKQVGRTSTQKSSADPVWNEQIVFTEMFPPLCRRLKIQVWDEGSMNDVAIGTHYIDLKCISNEQDGDKGFLPTFGPAWVNLYGSSRNASLGDDTAELNEGIRRGVSYRGRLFIELSVEIMSGGGTASVSKASPLMKSAKDKPGKPGGKDGKAPAGGAGGSAGGSPDDDKGKGVVAPEVLPVEPSSVATSNNITSYLLFGALFEATMIDRKIGDKPISFEFSIGNYGNVHEPTGQQTNLPVTSPAIRRKVLDVTDSDDGPSPSLSPSNPSSPLLSRETGDTSWTSKSTTPPEKPVTVSGNRYFMYLPLEKQKPCISILSQWEDRTYRLHTANMLEDIASLLEESIAKAEELNQKGEPGAEEMIKRAIKEFTADAKLIIEEAEEELRAQQKSTYMTQLDKKRIIMCKQELESLIEEGHTLMTRKRKAAAMKKMMQEARKLTQKLRFLVEEPQHTIPDVFVWLLSNNKRIAHARIRARDLLYCENEEARGVHCGKVMTLFLRPSGKRSSGLAVQAVVDAFLWLGTCEDAIHVLDDLPPGFTPTTAGGDPNNPPTHLVCAEQRQFQLRCHMYQARGLIAADASGLSDPFARVTFLSHSLTTNIINQTLSPTWNQCLSMSRICISGDPQYIKEEPPRILIEVYDDDALGKSEYLGSTVTIPEVVLSSESYRPPTLKYSPLHLGSQSGGDLLAAFELVEVPKSGQQILPPLEPRDGGIYAVPRNIRPVLSTYRLEVLFWGLRELKKVQLLTVDRPQVFIECAGKTLRSSVIQKYKSNPNFPTLVDTIELELPENEHLHPPLSITVVDWRAFGRSTLVGNHILNNLKGFKYTPPPPLPQSLKPKPTATVPPVKEEQLKVAGTSQQAGTSQDCLVTVDPDPAPDPLAPRQKSDTEGRKSKHSKREHSRSTKRRRRTIVDESAECVIDWWSKYYASVEKQKTKLTEEPSSDDKVRSSSDVDKKKKSKKIIPAATLPQLPKLATLQLYNKELEAEFSPFDDWVSTYELFRGRANDQDHGAAERFVGKFKGRFCLYKLSDERKWTHDRVLGSYRVSRGIPSNTPMQVLLRIYIVSATNLHPADPDGKADPYIVIRVGKNEIKDRDNYIPKQLNPVFGRSFEMQVTFPKESLLTLLIYDFDLVGGDDLIGETRIDLENRFYSRHRATCGLPTEYSLEGYNAWRDCLKPSELLAKLCKDNNLDPPDFSPGRITVADKVFTGKTLFMNEDQPVESYEQLSLKILHRWSEIPVVGCKLVPEHIETRTLFNKTRPGMDQGQVQMWVEMFPMDLPLPGPAADISPRKPKGYELRIIIWNTEDVILEDTSILTNQPYSDIYVKGWLKGLEDDRQETDVHHNSLTGEGNFNWRFVFPFFYLPAEKVVVVTKRESIFCLDKSEQKLPAILMLQVWDYDTLSADDFLGTVELDLHSFPRGAKTVKFCNPEMFTDGTERISIFQQKRARGWWPFVKSGELTGKVEAEFHLVTAEEAEKQPVGRARKEPEPLPPPNRPDTSFSWFTNPLKCFLNLLWKNYKKYIIIGLLLLITALFLVLLFYTLPGAISQKMVSG
ncbi:fer-1-like protein 6 [Synchiropus picturatus]